MIRHIAVFKWLEDTTPAQIEALSSALAQLPGQIPSIQRYQFGADLVLGDGRWDYGVTAEFDDAAGYHAYVDHPAHQAILTDHIQAMREDRAHVQLEA